MPILRSLPIPDSSVNVEALAQAENAEAKTVLSAMRRRSADKRLAAQEAAQAAMFPDPDPQRRYRHHHHQHQHHHYRRKRSSAGGVSFPPAEPSPMKQAQILRQRKENTTSMARATLEKGSMSDDFSGGGRTMPEVEGSEGGGEGRLASSREAARQLALHAASEGVGNYSRSDSCSDWTRCIAVIAVRQMDLSTRPFSQR